MLEVSDEDAQQQKERHVSPRLSGSFDRNVAMQTRIPPTDVFPALQKARIFIQTSCLVRELFHHS